MIRSRLVLSGIIKRKLHPYKELLKSNKEVDEKMKDLLHGTSQARLVIYGVIEKDLENAERQIQCKICKKFLAAGAMISHTESEHSKFTKGVPPKGPFRCSFCGKCFLTHVLIFTVIHPLYAISLPFMPLFLWLKPFLLRGEMGEMIITKVYRLRNRKTRESETILKITLCLKI